MSWLGSKNFPSVPSFSTFFWAGLGVTVFLLLLRTKGPKRAVVARLDTRLLLACLAAVVASLLFLAINPTAFSAVSRESRAVEDGSFLAWMVALLFAVVSWLPQRNRKAQGAWLLLLYGFAFFLCAMEEISWFQSQLGFATPALFAGNRHQETNLHNFALFLFEPLFFCGTGLFFLGVPLLRDFLPIEGRWAPYLRWLPATEELRWSVLFVALNYSAWGTESGKFIYFLALAVFAARAWWANTPQERQLYGAFAGAIVLIQSYLIARGYRQVRTHDITEHKELWAAVCYAAFSFRIYLRNRVAS